ncbi:MAG: hypothetical protein UY23_C0006G0036 [Candidatus Jorgensenbacteria bacterium GW2011_GWA1_48_11]|uniref:Uncharacterized protein n=1 Tax=Candidatus Jorgensenbacteria bacterium GW2011_GWA1_48_11 TaxID=1618660 RepID=A0A0G1U9N4_9BACT|nr:MAG: hypothetical protein UY23_C0006G0036 [Candidatus Jorgensenbacteria bacterium GW2011_GWA1_48_11]KKW12396.1 MAG: hypothetical protein UY51_C0005G0638 [Candidatus Jorgensenbacteria bacterium GW2011_GWB1_49_9]
MHQASNSHGQQKQVGMVAKAASRDLPRSPEVVAAAFRDPERRERIQQGIRGVLLANIPDSPEALRTRGSL